MKGGYHMADYYKNAILEQLEEMSENQLCFYYTLMMKLSGGEKTNE